MLMMAASLGLVEAVDTLVRCMPCDAHGNAIVNASRDDIRGFTPLHVAAISDRCDVIQYLLALPEIKANVLDNSGYTALHLAVMYGHHNAIKCLLEAPNVDANALSNWW